MSVAVVRFLSTLTVVTAAQVGGWSTRTVTGLGSEARPWASTAVTVNVALPDEPGLGRKTGGAGVPSNVSPPPREAGGEGRLLPSAGGEPRAVGGRGGRAPGREAA